MTSRSASVRNWTVALFLVACCFATRTNGSAIPMWEFLAREEKMSHLYKIFAKQVTRHCADSPSPDCNKNLLIAGVRSLANMDENDLDRMDPYQRDADDIIWRAIVRDNRLPAKFGQEGADYMSEEDPLAASDSENNGLGEESARSNDYARPSEHRYGGPYLAGPMVIRVFPDGRPVPEDTTRPLPRDEDVEDAIYSRIPSISEIEATGHPSRFNGPSRIFDLNANNAPGLYQMNKLSSRLLVLPPIPIKDSPHYRRLNSLQRDTRGAEISHGQRIVRFY